MIIDATNQILGRISTHAAKSALLGKEVSIINCEKAVISGNKKKTLSDFEHKRAMGIQAKGPYHYRRPPMFVKRALRGMLPYKQPKGRDALSRIKCYSGVPAEFEGKEITKIAGADFKKLPLVKFTTVGNMCETMGVKQ